MRIGLQIPRFNWPGGPDAIAGRLAEIARTAEEAGFASIWVMDHLLQIPFFGAVEDPMLESYTTLGYLAGVTERIRMGPMVGAVVFREPALLIKAATTLNVLSRGRSYFSIGSCWYEDEARALGLPWPERNVRFQMVEDVLQLAHQMWRDDDGVFEGRHVQAPRPLNRPQPVGGRRSPILIGGNGEQRTLRLVAEYGDACNLLSLQPEQVRAKLEILERHCDAVGRTYEEIERTSLNPVRLGGDGMSPDEMVRWLRAMAEAGSQHAIVNLPDVHELRSLEIFGRDIIPQITGATVASR